MISNAILENCKNRKKNLSTAWSAVLEQRQGTLSTLLSIPMRVTVSSHFTDIAKTVMHLHAKQFNFFNNSVSHSNFVKLT